MISREKVKAKAAVMAEYFDLLLSRMMWTHPEKHHSYSIQKGIRSSETEICTGGLQELNLKMKSQFICTSTHCVNFLTTLI